MIRSGNDSNSPPSWNGPLSSAWGADVALIEMDVVYAVQAVGVSELGVDRLVQVPVEFRTECIQFASCGLALIEVKGQQVLQVIGVGAAARWQCAAQREVKERSLDVVQ